MHRRGDPSMGADSSQIPPQELEARKRELEAEFQRYMNKAPGQAKQRLTMSSKPGVEIGLRNFLAELTSDNKKKSKTQSAYAEKYQRIVFGPSNGQSSLASTYTQGFNKNSCSVVKDFGRLTNGFNRAANEKSMYMPSMALKDSECKELFVESIHQNLANVMEEQESHTDYQDVLRHMLVELDHDKLLYKKRCRQMQDEAAMADKQAKQCDYLDSSVHFMELALASKTAMAKSKHDQNKREVESMISGAQRDLADEREELEKMKAEIVVAMKEYEMLRAEKQRINLELFEVEEEGEQYQRAIADTKASTRQLQQQILDIDAMISYYNQEKITKPPSYYKLTQREFDIKYQSGYDSFVSQVVEILSSRTSSSKFAESNHRGLLESLFAKKKELKKIQEELNMVREIYKPTEKPIVEAQVAKKDEKDEQTEDSIQNMDGEDSVMTRDQKDAMVPASNLFHSLRHEIGGHKHRERWIIDLATQIESHILNSAKVIESLRPYIHPSRPMPYSLGQIVSLAASCDHLIIGLQSKISLGDYTLHDASNLLYGDHRTLVTIDDMTDDDKSIIYVTMHNDSMANTYLTPGLFAALCEGDRQDSKDVTNLMIKVKQAAYNNLSDRLDSVMHKYMTLLTFASQEVDRSENTNQRDGLRSQHSAAQASQSKDSRLVSTNLSSHRIADDTSTQHGQTGRWSTTSKGEPRANSSHLGRRMSDVDQRKLTDREMKSFLKEKDDLMNLYPQLKDMESNHVIREEMNEDDFAYARPPKLFNKTSSGFRVKENPTASRKVTTGTMRKRQVETHTDLEPIKIEPPKYVRPNSNDYRISKRSKSSAGNRQNTYKQDGTKTKVSPYAQPLPNQEERRRRLLKLLQ